MTFLGTAIGVMGGGGFRAAEAVAVGTLGQTLNQRLIRLHGLGPAMRRKFRAAFLCRVGDEEHWVWAPGVTAEGDWTWTFAPIVALYPFTAGGVKLTDDQGYVLDMAPFAPRPVARGEAFRLVASLDRVPPVAALRNDCTISGPCERLIVAHHLGHRGANAQEARGGAGAGGGGTAH